MLAQVSVTEPTGSETQVFAKVGEQKIVGVFRERITVNPGEQLALSPNLDYVHLFDPDDRRPHAGGLRAAQNRHCERSEAIQVSAMLGWGC